MQNDLLKKLSEFGMGSIFSLILGVISTPIITRLISPEHFGISSLFNTLTNLLSVFIVLGFDQAFVRYFYEEKEENRGKLLITTLKVPIIINLVLSVLVIIFYKPISYFILGEYSIILSLLVIIQNTFFILNRFALLVVRMHQKGKLYSFLQVLGQFSYIVGVVGFFLLMGDQKETVIFGLLSSNVVIVILGLFYERKFWLKSIKNSPTTYLNTNLIQLFKFGSPWVFTLMINWVFVSIDKLFIKGYCGDKELGIYTSAYTIIALLNVIQTTFNTFWVPVSYDLYKTNKDHKQIFINVMSLIAFVMFILCIGLIMTKDLVVYFLGDSYREATFIIPFLAFIPLMNTVSETTVVGINLMKKPQKHIYVSLVSCIVNICGNILLIPILGGIGASISTGISYVVFFIMRTTLSQRIYKVNFELKKFYLSTISLLVLSLYASFNVFSGIYFLVCMMSVVIISLLYYNNIKTAISDFFIKKNNE